MLSEGRTQSLRAHAQHTCVNLTVTVSPPSTSEEGGLALALWALLTELQGLSLITKLQRHSYLKNIIFQDRKKEESATKFKANTV